MTRICRPHRRLAGLVFRLAERWEGRENGARRLRCGTAARSAAVVMTVVLGLASASAAQVKDWPSEDPPRALPAHEVKFPPYEMRTLANGMRVVVVLHHEQPAVSIRLLVRAGGVYDPPGRPGVAALAASLLDQGTTTKSAGQIADAIDFIGGALGTGAGSDLTFVNAVVMKDSFTLAMDLIADVVHNPAFAPEEIERQRQQALSGMQVSQTSPAYVASAVFDRIVYGLHPYGLPNNGTPESLAAITRADLQSYHRRFFVPNNMILGIVGDVTGAEAFAQAERAFGTWARAEVPAVTLPEPPPPARRVVVVDMPDAVQTELRVGQLGIPRKHRDYLPIDLGFRILGGEGANRLHRVLRSERGLTYGASADIEALKQGGDFVAETNTRTETTGEALKLIVEQYQRLQRERVGERELGDAQAYLAGNFPLTIESPDAIATQVLNTVFYELPIEEVGTFPQRVQSVTPDDIQRVARTYVFPDRLTVVLVGNAAKFVSQLKGAGFSEFEVIPFAQVDLASPLLRRDRTRADAGREASQPAIVRAPTHVGRAFTLRTPTNVGQAFTLRTPTNVGRAFTARLVGYAQREAGTVSSARDLLARVIAAKGGLATLRAVHSVVADAETTFRTAQGPMRSGTTTYVVYPDRFRVEASVGGADVAQVYNAGIAWVRDPGGVHDAPPPMRADFAASVQRDTIPLLIGASDGVLPSRVLPEEGGNGRVYKVIEISSLAGPVKLYIDAAGLIARQAYSGPGPDGRPLIVEEAFSDYRKVDGVQVPFRAELHHNGQPILERVFTGVRINSAVDLALFSKPH